jgi:CBS domain-containing protein
MMKKIQHFLTEAKQKLITVSPEDRVFFALTQLAEHNLSSLLVVDNGKLVGIFSERDYARKVTLQGKNSQSSMVKDVMTSNLITMRPDQAIAECMQIMTDRHIRHLPILDNDEKLVGIVSIGDVVKETMEEQRRMIEELQRYIAG